MPPHQTHREGKNVDIGATTAEGGLVTKDQLDQIIQILLSIDYITVSYEDNPSHFHLTYLK
jgi:hypothetical protein